MAQSITFQHGDTQLAATDFGGDGATVMLLHGLAGHAGEWAQTADGLRPRARSLAMDTRGHGASERWPDDVSPETLAADVAVAIEQLAEEPVVCVGQSFGALTAILLAALRPELVRGLVVIEADPGPGDERSTSLVGAWLRSWPVPFPSRTEAQAFFGGSAGRAAAWAGGLERRDDGLWPRFEVDVLVAMLAEASGRSYWSEWERIRAPTLVVRGLQGELDAGCAAEMTNRLPGSVTAAIPDAGHDLHLDQPGEWQRALSGFLDALGIERPSRG